jgi:hypothetical protein
VKWFVDVGEKWEAWKAKRSPYVPGLSALKSFTRDDDNSEVVPRISLGLPCSSLSWPASEMLEMWHCHAIALIFKKYRNTLD